MASSSILFDTSLLPLHPPSFFGDPFSSCVGKFVNWDFSYLPDDPVDDSNEISRGRYSPGT